MSWRTSVAGASVFVDYISEVPNGSVVVYSAHGISPAIRDEARRRSLIEVDATCPLVIKVHGEVQAVCQRRVFDHLHWPCQA